MHPRILVRLLIALATFITGAAASAADVTSRVEAVTVFPSGALVTRSTQITVQPGDNDVRLVGLVESLETESLQAEVSDPTVTIGQLKIDRVQSQDAYDAEVARLEAKIDSLRQDIQAVDDSTAAAERQLRFLDGLSVSYARDAGLESGRGAASIESLRAALGLLQSGSEAASATVRENSAQKKALTKEISALQRTLADLRGGSLASTVIDATLNAQRATTVTLRLHYYQDSARWWPVYEARLDTDSGALTLHQQANVEQETDEDWQSVALTLSTSQPTGDLEAPDLASEFLDLRDRVVVTAGRAQPMMQSRGQVAADSALMEELVVVTGTRRVDTNFAVNYQIPGRSTVANNADEAVNLDIESFRFDAELVTRVVPRSSTDAFLTARFTHDQSVPLYSSDMRIYVDGSYVGVATMPTALPGAEVLLPMGQDRRVQVRVQSQGGEGGERGLIGRTNTEVTDYVFEITNRRATSAYVEVFDRIPVARDRAIDVEMGDDATEADASDIDDRPGLLRWQRSLAPGEDWRIRHQYSVSYPRDRELARQNSY